LTGIGITGVSVDVESLSIEGEKKGIGQKHKKMNEAETDWERGKKREKNGREINSLVAGVMTR
jgi:hypothetical protein